jgi:hypothetical protein
MKKKTKHLAIAGAVVALAYLYGQSQKDKLAKAIQSDLTKQAQDAINLNPAGPHIELPNPDGDK